MNKTQVKGMKKKDLVDNFMYLQKRNEKQVDDIKELMIINAQMSNDLKLSQDTADGHMDGQLQAKSAQLKKKDQIIKDLEKQIDSTKINHITNLENIIHCKKAHIDELQKRIEDQMDTDNDIREKYQDKIKDLKEEAKERIAENEAFSKKLERLDEVGLGTFYRTL